jgi:hypothetical protein
MMTLNFLLSILVVFVAGMFFELFLRKPSWRDGIGTLATLITGIYLIKTNFVGC